MPSAIATSGVMPKRQRLFTIQIRVTQDERLLFADAATSAGLAISSWARSELLRLARGKEARP